jgi:hypothetical protein
MGDGVGPRQRPDVREALRKLTTGAGVQREDLMQALQGELRELQRWWKVNLDNAEVAGRTVMQNLEEHIKKLSPRSDRQYRITPSQRRQQYEHAIRVCFNMYRHKELERSTLTQRQEWLDKLDIRDRKYLRIDGSTCRRDLRDALDQITEQILAPDFRPVQIGEVIEDSSGIPDVESSDTSGDSRLDESAVLAAVETIIDAVRARAGKAWTNFLDRTLGRRAVRWGIYTVLAIYSLYVFISAVISGIQDAHHPPLNAQLSAEAMNFTDGKWLSTLYVHPGDRVTLALTVKDTDKVSIEFDGIMPYNGGILEYVTDSTSVAPTLIAPGKPVPDRSDPWGDPFDSQSGATSRLVSPMETIRPGQQVVLKFEFVVNDHIGGGANFAVTPILNVSYYETNFPAISVHIVGLPRSKQLSFMH